MGRIVTMASKFQTKLINKYKADGCIVLNLIRLSSSGYPDLLILKDGKAKFIECKEGNDTLKPLQRLRIKQLREQGFEAICLHETKGKLI